MPKEDLPTRAFESFLDQCRTWTYELYIPNYNVFGKNFFLFNFKIFSILFIFTLYCRLSAILEGGHFLGTLFLL